MTTDRLQAGKNGESECIILYTLTRVEADITSSLGMKTTTELCHQKCRRIQACGHNRAGIGIYIMGVGSGGGGRRQRETVILCSASTQCGQLRSSSRNKEQSHMIYTQACRLKKSLFLFCILVLHVEPCPSLGAPSSARGNLPFRH